MSSANFEVKLLLTRCCFEEFAARLCLKYISNITRKTKENTMGKDSKRRKSYYVNFAKRQKFVKNILAPNMVGFLCTCNDREKECVKEAYHILNQFADELYGKEEDVTAIGSEQEEMAIVNQDGATAAKKEQEIADPSMETATTVDDVQKKSIPEGDADAEHEVWEGEKNEKEASDEEEDIEAAVKAEVTTLKKDKAKSRFQQVRCYASNCVFISTTLQDPVEISLAIMNSIIETKKQITKSLLRLVPVQSTCKAYTEDIIKCGRALCKTYFSDKELTHFIVFKARSNNNIKRDPVVQGLSQAIQELSPNSKPERKTPDIVVCVEVMRDVCGISLLPNYFNKYYKYNLVELALRQGKDKVQDAPDQKGKDKVQDAPDQKGDVCNKTNSDLAPQIQAEVASESLGLQDEAGERTQVKEDATVEMP